ncbi:hypothetical protein NQZ68_036309 [Dissostichus eleginoides]|nr:hypothetical protein NQZ68_036309 [Dissostichus eleginoides]
MGSTYSVQTHGVQTHGDHLLCPDAWGSPTLSRRMGSTYSVQTHGDHLLCPDAWGSPTLSRRIGITYSVQTHGDHLLCPDAWGSPTLSRRMGITYSIQTHGDHLLCPDAWGSPALSRRMGITYTVQTHGDHLPCPDAWGSPTLSRRMGSTYPVRRNAPRFFGFAVNNKLKQLTPDLAKKCEADFLVFYERAKNYVSERYDFSENSFHSKVSKLGLTTAVSYGEYSDAVQACSLKDIDMDGLYEEYGMVEAILRSSEMEGCHSEERYLKLFSKAEVPLVNLRKVSAYIFSIPCSNVHTERVFSMMTSAWRN